MGVGEKKMSTFAFAQQLTIADVDIAVVGDKFFIDSVWLNVENFDDIDTSPDPHPSH